MSNLLCVVPKKLVIMMFFLMASSQTFGRDWPQEVDIDNGTLVIYQPQPESMKKNIITARAAISIESDGAEEAAFGVAWFSAQVTTDRNADLAQISHIHVDRLSWPDSKDTQEQSLSNHVEAAFAGSVMDISLSNLSASLAASEKAHKSLDNINNEPPIIVFREELALLLLFDGSPTLSTVEDSPYERVLNTAMIVVKDTRSNLFYLTSGNLWYQARDAMGPWQVITTPPEDLQAMVSANSPKGSKTAQQAPAIVTASAPTELIVSTGAPNWTSLDGGQLLYVQNTETPWIRDLAGGNMYVQLSGRWFRAKSAKDDWTFVRADKLPESFQTIPPASDIGGLRSSIAGTEEANEAVADAQIPQTAAIKRDEATLSVEYDGKPAFKSIKGTEVEYAVNTGAQILRVDGRYYAVDNGIWFSSGNAEGPWTVSDSVPDQKIAAIPPTSPVYNTTHVHIYESTPKIVYVGYTPGYLWSFRSYGVPVYGTGWHYPAYYGRYYYPRTPTWGFHVGYNPWMGWNYGVSWGAPFYSAGVAWGGGWRHRYRPGRCCGGYYAGGYRHGDVKINTGDINIGNSVNIGRHHKTQGRHTKDMRASNLYHNAANKKRIARQSLAHTNFKKARKSTKKNNVFADQHGRVARRDATQWQVRKDSKWQATTGRRDLALPTIRHTKAARVPTTRAGVSPKITQTRQSRPALGNMHSQRPMSQHPMQRATPKSRGFDHAHMDRQHKGRTRGKSKSAQFR